MSEMSKKARSAMRAKANRMAGTDTENGRNDPHKKVDASSWVPNESLNTTRKTGARPIRSRIYKAGGRIQGDRAIRADKMPRGGKANGGALSIHDTVGENKSKLGSYHEGGYKKGGHAKRHKRDMGGMADPRETASQTLAAGAARSGVAPNRMQFQGTGKPFGALRSGGRADAKSKADRYCEGGRAEGGRSKRAHGGRAKGKTNINIIIGRGGHEQPQMPPQGVVRPPVPPPMPPPQGMPPPGGPPPGLGSAGPPPGGPPMPMPRKRGGMVPMKAGAGSGLGRLEKKKAYGVTPP